LPFPFIGKDWPGWKLTARRVIPRRSIESIQYKHPRSTCKAVAYENLFTPCTAFPNWEIMLCIRFLDSGSSITGFSIQGLNVPTPRIRLEYFLALFTKWYLSLLPVMQALSSLVVLAFASPAGVACPCLGFSVSLTRGYRIVALLQ
jgi:hypothetical protein